MTDSWPPGAPSLDVADPEAVAAAEFALARRGYDRDEVRRHLHAVASHVRVLHERVAALQIELDAARRRAVSMSELDDDELAHLVGEETTRVIVAGRHAAEERVQRAEAQSEAVLEAARADSARRRAQADEVASQRLAEADAAVAQRQSDGEARLAEIDQIIEAEVARGREEARILVEEARLVRHRMLEDLSNRRHAMRTQIEQLRAGRERLLGAYDHVRRTLEESTQELQYSLQDARVAAETAGRRIVDEPLSVEDLEEEIAAARLVGHPMVDLSSQGPSTAEVEIVLVVSEEVPVDVLVETGFEAELAAAEVEPDPEIEEPDPEGDEPDAAVDELETAAVAVEPEPEPESEPEPELESEPDLAVQEEPNADVTPDDAPDVSDDSTSPGAPDVDDLFSTMRKRRLERLASAEAVLEDVAPAAVAEPAIEEPVTEELVTAEPVAAERVDTASSPPAEPAAPVTLRVVAPSAALADELVRAVKRSLSEEQNEALDLVRRRKGDISVDELLGLTDIHAARVASSMADLVSRAQADQIASAVVGVVRRRVTSCLSEDAGDVDRILTRIRSIYRDVRSHQVREVVSASGAAA